MGLNSFLFYALKERFFKDNLVGNGSIFASISKDDLLSQSFMTPSYELCVQFNSIIQNMDKRIEILDTQTELLVAARDRLLPKLMSGEMQV